jgi:hypothetical protein
LGIVFAGSHDAVSITNGADVLGGKAWRGLQSKPAVATCHAGPPKDRLSNQSGEPVF